MLPCLRPTCAGYTAPCPYPCFKISMQQGGDKYKESGKKAALMIRLGPYMLNPRKMLIPVIIRNICAVSVRACA